MWAGRTVTKDALEANTSRDQLLLRAAPKTLPEAYNDSQLMAALHERYGNWMLYRLSLNTSVLPALTGSNIGGTSSLSSMSSSSSYAHHALHAAFREVKRSLRDFAFIGLTDHYRTSLCLLAFQFHLHVEFSLCQTRSLNAYNAACYDGGKTNADCAEGQAFTNKFDVEHEKLLHSDQRRAVVPNSIRPVVHQHTTLDQRLFFEASRVFWARVRVMEDVTGRRFDDMPRLWRNQYPS